MNDLSWMLYAGGVVGDVKGLFLTASVFGLVGGGFCALFGGIEDVPGLKRIAKFALPLGFVAALIATLLPSQTTVYAIAASEMSERAISTPIGAKAMKALDAWLNRQITGEEPAHN